jgi:hypothetical protein
LFFKPSEKGEVHVANIKDPMATMKAKLDALISGLFSGAKLKLGSNNVTISETTVLGDFTECSFTGYSAQTLSGFGSAADDGSHHAFSTASPAGFTPSSSSGSIYTAYITNSGGTVLLGAATFAGAPITVAGGVTLSVTVTVLQGTIY